MQKSKVCPVYLNPQKAKDSYLRISEKRIINKHVKDKGYNTMSKQLNVSVTTDAHNIQKFKVDKTVANLNGCRRRRKMDDKLKKQMIPIATKEITATFKEI